MARKPEVVRKQLQNARAQERACHSKVVQLEKELAKATGKPRKASAPRKERVISGTDPYRKTVYEVQEQVKDLTTGRLRWEDRTTTSTRAEAEAYAAQETRFSSFEPPTEKGGRLLLGKYRVRETSKVDPLAIKSAYAEASSKLKAAAKPRGFLGLW